MIPTTQEVKQGWNEFSEMYSQTMEKANLQLGLALSRMLQVDSAKNILEVGCGSGVLAIELLQTFPNGIKYTSMDLAEEMIKLAEKRKQGQLSKLNNIEHSFITGDAEDLSFIPDESVDVYLSNLCIHIVTDPEKALKQAMRVLKKGGKIGLSVLGRYEKCDIFSMFGDALKELKIETPPKRSYFRYGEREALVKLAQENGFEVDFCWVEQVTVGVFSEEDLDLVWSSPFAWKILKQLDVETQSKIKYIIKKKFEEKKKNFLPLQTENALLIGRKSS